MAGDPERTISKIVAEAINDSRGNPTLKVSVWAGEFSGSFEVPSGASTGTHEAHELRDPDGKGVQKAIEKIEKIITPGLLGKDVLNQRDIDRTLNRLDGTSNKDNLGGNSTIGVSVACAKAAARVSGQELFEYLQTLAEIKPSRTVPYLYMNLINGGKHAKNDLAFQEYHLVPETEDAKEAVEIGQKMHSALKEIIERELGSDSTMLGDEGGFAPKISDVEMPLRYLQEAAKNIGVEDRVRFALDVASSSFYENGNYRVDGKLISSDELKEIYKKLTDEYNLLSIEDPFFEEDFANFRTLGENKQKLIVIGDDLTVTNVTLLQKAISENSISGMIIKPNQIGTLMETLQAMKLARDNGIELIVSHRSGETNDDFIADLAFAFNCFGIKAGAPSKPERMVKYERLIKISKLL